MPKKAAENDDTLLTLSHGHLNISVQSGINHTTIFASHFLFALFPKFYGCYQERLHATVEDFSAVFFFLHLSHKTSFLTENVDIKVWCGQFFFVSLSLHHLFNQGLQFNLSSATFFTWTVLLLRIVS